jgi:hypothetical protein
MLKLFVDVLADGRVETEVDVRGDWFSEFENNKKQDCATGDNNTNRITLMEIHRPPGSALRSYRLTKGFASGIFDHG